MKENKEKREFARQAVKNSEGRAYILIGIDRKEGEDGDTQGVIAVSGAGSQVIEGLANFFAEEKTAPLASEAMKLATLKKLSRLLETE